MWNGRILTKKRYEWFGYERASTWFSTKHFVTVNFERNQKLTPPILAGYETSPFQVPSSYQNIALFFTASIKASSKFSWLYLYILAGNWTFWNLSQEEKRIMRRVLWPWWQDSFVRFAKICPRIQFRGQSSLLDRKLKLLAANCLEWPRGTFWL